MRWNGLFYLSEQLPPTCESDCHCFAKLDNGHHVIVADCSNSQLTQLPSILPAETEWLILANNSISHLHYQTYFKHLSKLNLHGNKIGNLTKHFVDDLIYSSQITHLSIAHNQLKSLPRNVLNFTLQSSISVSGNPLRCSCDSVWMKHWVLNNSNIMGQVTCQMDSGRWISVVQMDKADLGCDKFPKWGIAGRKNDISFTLEKIQFGGCVLHAASLHCISTLQTNIISVSQLFTNLVINFLTNIVCESHFSWRRFGPHHGAGCGLELGGSATLHLGSLWCPLP